MVVLFSGHSKQLAALSDAAFSLYFPTLHKLQGFVPF
jgi:hypothetical protein